MKFNMYKNYSTEELVKALEIAIDEYAQGGSALKMNLIKNEIKERLSGTGK